jgi:hypothetical protein
MVAKMDVPALGSLDLTVPLNFIEYFFGEAKGKCFCEPCLMPDCHKAKLYLTISASGLTEEDGLCHNGTGLYSKWAWVFM